MLLTRSPLSCSLAGTTAFDLHVLGTPPALILSQDQTLMLNGLLLPFRAWQLVNASVDLTSSCLRCLSYVRRRLRSLRSFFGAVSELRRIQLTLDGSSSETPEGVLPDTIKVLARTI